MIWLGLRTNFIKCREYFGGRKGRNNKSQVSSDLLEIMFDLRQDVTFLVKCWNRSLCSD